MNLNKIYLIYNNEAIIYYLIFEILAKCENIDIIRLYIIVLLLLNDKARNTITLHNYATILDIISSKRSNFVNIATQFETLLSNFLNALTLLQESLIISIQDRKIIFSKKHISIPSDSKRLHNMLEDVDYILDKTSKISTSDLIKKLNIRL